MTKIDFDLGRSLQELEGVDWGEPTYDSSLVNECHRLRRVALRDFEVEDLRRMIGQQIGLRYLVPLAFQELHERPQAEGDLYEGALFAAVLSVEASFWKTRPDLASELMNFVNGLTHQLKHMATFERNGLLKVLVKNGPVFISRCGIPGASLADYGKPDKNEELSDEDFAELAASFFRQLDAEEKHS